jgi:fucose permease
MSPMDDHEESPLLAHRASPQYAEQYPIVQMQRHVALKIAAAMFSFSTLGIFNSSIGAVLPLISRHYSLTDLHVSFLFLAGPVGYILAAQFSDTVHWHFGQRGIAFLGPTLQLIATLTIGLHPSFRLVLVGFTIAGAGIGLLDGSWCAWAGNMEKANTISGLLHGSYSVGGAAGPFLVTLITTGHHQWYIWYYILVSPADSSISPLVLMISPRLQRHASNYWLWSLRSGMRQHRSIVAPSIQTCSKIGSM